MKLFNLLQRRRTPAHPVRCARTRLAVESLEVRIVPITNGLLDGMAHPNVGAIVLIQPPTDLPDFPVPGIACSGTLIHSSVFLTAAHCTEAIGIRLRDGRLHLDDIRVSFGHDAFDPTTWLEISDVIMNPEFRQPPNSAGAQVGDDIGALILKRPVKDITPANLAPLGLLEQLKSGGQLRESADGALFTVVGFGTQLDAPPPVHVPPDGLRRVAQSEYLALEHEWLTVSQQFATDLGGAGYGDSGGPLFWVNPSTGDEILVSLSSRGDLKGVATGVSYRVDIASSLGFISAVIATVEGGGSALTATLTGPGQGIETLRSDQVQPLLAEAVRRWDAAELDPFDFGLIDIRIANLGGATLGLAAGSTIWLDDNAAGWGWFVDPTPYDDSEFTTPGNQGEMNRMDLLTVLAHEIGHLLGQDHADDGVMADLLATGIRRMPGSTEVNDCSAFLDVLASERLSKRKR